MYIVLSGLNRYPHKFRVGSDNIGRNIPANLTCKLRELLEFRV